MAHVTTLSHLKEDVPLTHPDRVGLIYLADHLEATIRALPAQLCASPPYFFHQRAAGVARRVVLFQHPTYVLDHACHFVAFFGMRRPHLAQGLIDAVTADDERLMDAMMHYPQMLGYTSLELADHNWCNLVLFRDVAALDFVQTHEAHQHASRQLAAQYYSQIRLYHGMLREGIAEATRHFQFEQTQTYTFGAADAKSFA